MKLISNWSWLLRDSTSSDAKPSLEEALQKCSDVTLWFAKSDAFGHFWTLLDTFGHFWSLEAMFDSFVRVETLLCNLAPDISRCFSSCCKFLFLIYFPLFQSVSSACGCQNMMFVSKPPWKRLYLPKRLKKHPTRKGMSRSLVLSCLAVVKEHRCEPWKASKFASKDEFDLQLILTSQG